MESARITENELQDWQWMYALKINHALEKFNIQYQFLEKGMILNQNEYGIIQKVRLSKIFNFWPPPLDHFETIEMTS